MNSTEKTQQNASGDETTGIENKAGYVKPDIDSARGELMQTIRGTGGACTPATAADGEECNSN